MSRDLLSPRGNGLPLFLKIPLGVIVMVLDGTICILYVEPELRARTPPRST